MKRNRAKPSELKKVFLCVDGGASNGRAALVDYSGNCLFSHIARGLNPWLLSDAEFETRLTDLVGPLFAALDGSPNFIRARIALAGIGESQTYRRARKIIGRVLANFSQTNQVVLKTDVSTLVDVLIGSEGVVLVAGTGSICVAVSRSRMVRVGGWGFLFDKGSGFEIGMKAIIAYFDACDRGKRIAWLEELLETDPPRQWVASGLHELCMRVASVARIVLEVSEKGDPVARKISEDAAHDLTKLVECAWNKAGLRGRKPVYLSGGLMRNEKFFRLLRDRLMSVLPTAQVCAVNQSLLELMIKFEGGLKIKSWTQAHESY